MYFIIKAWKRLECESDRRVTIMCLYFFIFKGHPSPEPGKICAALNPGKGAKWENRECDQKLGYICKRGNATLESFIIPTGRFGNKPSTNYE